MKRVNVALRPGLGRRPHLPPRREGPRQPAPDPGRVLDHAAVEVRHPTTSRGGPRRASPGRPTRRSPARSRARIPLAFYAALGREMRKFPAPAADRPLLAQLKAVGIGPALSPATRTSAPTRSAAFATRSPRDRTRSGPRRWRSTLQDFDKHNGYLVADLGGWGTDYTAARDRRPARCRRPAGQHRDLPGRPVRQHEGPAHRIERGTSCTSRRAACRSRSRRSGR